ncbi:MAG TPA: IPT/TIG domain-containing protein [Geobacteraceae bacterium]|nr:IPT/TIG domain-containing protein [Geobacteraceae bacterium]
MVLRIAALLMTFTTVLTNPAFGATQAKTTQNHQPPINILSIIPAQGEPGISVTLYGSGFSEGITAFLGNTQIPAQVYGQKQLSFEIPSLDPGLYALYLKRKDGSASKIYNFTILPLKPVVMSLLPDKISSCDYGGAREVQVNGKNFQPGSMIMFDGAAIGSRFISPEAISFTAPGVQAGLHQVQVKNPGDALSTVMALFIDAKPEILGISQGSESVNSYNLVINGRNFLPNSSLIVDGTRLSGLSSTPAGREKMIYVDCNQIIYERYPYDTTPKNIRLQVLNPGGEASSVVQITAP